VEVQALWIDGLLQVQLTTGRGPCGDEIVRCECVIVGLGASPELWRMVWNQPRILPHESGGTVAGVGADARGHSSMTYIHRQSGVKVTTARYTSGNSV
jgi:hypothetical protein